MLIVLQGNVRQEKKNYWYMLVLRPFLTKIVSFVRGILIYKQIALIWLDVDFGFVRSSMNKTEFLYRNREENNL